MYSLPKKPWQGLLEAEKHTPYPLPSDGRGVIPFFFALFFLDAICFSSVALYACFSL
jgi:hypothetical protein